MEPTGEAVPRRVKTVGKASLWRVPADHFSTLYDNRTGRPDWRGIAAQALLPLIAGAATWKLGAKITDVGGVHEAQSYGPRGRLVAGTKGVDGGAVDVFGSYRTA